MQERDYSLTLQPKFVVNPVRRKFEMTNATVCEHQNTIPDCNSYCTHETMMELTTILFLRSTWYNASVNFCESSFREIVSFPLPRFWKTCDCPFGQPRLQSKQQVGREVMQQLMPDEGLLTTRTVCSGVNADLGVGKQSYQ